MNESFSPETKYMLIISRKNDIQVAITKVINFVLKAQKVKVNDTWRDNPLIQTSICLLIWLPALKYWSYRTNIWWNSWVWWVCSIVHCNNTMPADNLASPKWITRCVIRQLWYFYDVSYESNYRNFVHNIIHIAEIFGLALNTFVCFWAGLFPNHDESTYNQNFLSVKISVSVNTISYESVEILLHYEKSLKRCYIDYGVMLQITMSLH